MKGTYCGRRVILLAALSLLAVALGPAAALADANLGAGLPTSVVPSTPTAPAAPSLPIPVAPATAVSQVVSAPAVAPVAAHVKAAVKAVTHQQVVKLATRPAARTVVKPMVKPAEAITRSAVAKAAAAAKAKPHARVRVHVRVLATDSLTSGLPTCQDSFPNATTQITRCENLPLDAVLPNQCNGDLVELHGTFQYFMKTVVDPVHNAMTIYEKLTWTGVYGHAIQDGNPYVAYDRERTFQWSRTFAMGTKTKTITDHSEFNTLISQGPDPDQYVFVKTHTAVLADFTNPLNPVLDVTFDRTAGITCIYGDCHSSTVDP